MLSEEDLSVNIGALPDEDLIIRWQSGAFSKEAKPIAQSEIQRRGLDVSERAFQEILDDRASSKRAQSARGKGIATDLFKVFWVYGGAGLLLVALAFIMNWIFY